MSRKPYKPRRISSRNLSYKVDQEKGRAHKTVAKNFFAYVVASYVVMALSIIYFSFLAYDSYMKSRNLEMEAAAYEIEMSFTNSISYAESVLNYVNRQIVLSKATNAEIAEILSSFNRSHRGYNSIKDVLSVGMLYWVDEEKRLVASSSGAIVTPIDLSSRDYLSRTKDDPWKIYTGSPVIGAASGQYVMPAAVGVYSNGKYFGTSVVSFKVYNLVEKFKRLTGYYGDDFAILDSNNKLLMESESGLFSEDKTLLSKLEFSTHSLHPGLVSKFSPFKQNGHYLIVRNMEKYPYKILIGTQNSVLTKEIMLRIMPHLIELVLVTIFFIVVLTVLRRTKI